MILRNKSDNQLKYIILVRSSPEWTPSNIALGKIFMGSSLFNQVINLLININLLPMLELKTSQLIINSLNNNLCSLIKFLSPSLFTFLFDILHQLLFFHSSAKLTLSIVLIVFFFSMMLLIPFKYLLYN